MPSTVAAAGTETLPRGLLSRTWRTSVPVTSSARAAQVPGTCLAPWVSELAGQLERGRQLGEGLDAVGSLGEAPGAVE